MAGSEQQSIVELERALLGGDRKYDRNEVARRAGASTGEGEELWRALGFPATADDEKAFTDADVEALVKVRSLIEHGWLDEQTTVAMTRAMGQTLSRLAEWQVSTLTTSGLDVSGPEWAVTRARELVPEVEQLIGYVWRRHMAAIGGRALAGEGEQMTSRLLTVGFVDLVNYTSLTRHIDESELAALIEKFDEIASGTVADQGGRVVKTVGDEVLFVADEPSAGARIGLEISSRIASDDSLPDTRTGMACGTVLSRLGDVYGEPVNIAARLTGIARPGSVLVDRSLAETLGDADEFRLRRLPPRPVRGYAMLHAYRLRAADDSRESGHEA